MLDWKLKAVEGCAGEVLTAVQGRFAFDIQFFAPEDRFLSTENGYALGILEYPDDGSRRLVREARMFATLDEAKAAAEVFLGAEKVGGP